ncbi:MAG: oligosaccharide flippase family protein [Solobacterium sp.]|nr:oligosaccharide flippase family protein [Solobacterium sp.]
MSELFGRLKAKYASFSAPVRASFWTLVCSVFQSAVSLVTTPVFTRILTQEEFGIYNQYSSWLAILSILITLNLPSETYLRGLTDHEQDENAFTSIMLGESIAIFCIFLLLFLLAPSFWAKLFNLTPLLAAMMFVHLFVSTPFDYWKSRERSHYRYKLSSLLSVLVTLLSYGFSIQAVRMSADFRLEARVAGDLAVRVLVGVPLLVLLLWKGKKLYDRAVWLSALAFSIPLIPHYLSGIILNQSDRIMIGQMAGNAEAGRYSIAYMIASMVLMIVTAINSSYVPFTFQKLKSGEPNAIYSSSRILFAGIALLCLGAMGLAPEVITVFAGEGYSEAAGIVPSVSASVFFIFVCTLFSNVEYHYKKTQWIGAATLAAAVLNVSLNALLIPVYGYMAAGATTLISYLFLAVFHYLVYRKIQQEEGLPAVYDLKLITASGTLLIVLTALARFLMPYPILRWIIVLVSSAAALILIISALKRR